ncbi:MAG: hypothetical protein ACXAD7_04875 [Candidatus Kariarchaeaceae archaeon]|jgi:hypothetical protein
MSEGFAEFPGRVIIRSDEGEFYEITEWEISKNGQMLANEKRLLGIKEVKRILEQIDKNR